MKIGMGQLAYIMGYQSNAGGTCYAFSYFGSRAARRYGQAGIDAFEKRLNLINRLCDLGNEIKHTPINSVELFVRDIDSLHSDIFNEISNNWLHASTRHRRRHFDIHPDVEKAVKTKLQELKKDELIDLDAFFTGIDMVQRLELEHIQELAPKDLFKQNYSAYKNHIISLTLPKEANDRYKSALDNTTRELKREQEAKTPDNKTIQKLNKRICGYEAGEEVVNTAPLWTVSYTHPPSPRDS